MQFVRMVEAGSRVSSFSMLYLPILLVVTASNAVVMDFRQLVFGKTICCVTPQEVLFESSPLDCIRQCLSRQYCTVMSYQRKSLQCRLFDVDSTSSSFEEDDPSYVMAVMNQWSKDLISPCTPHLCSGFDKCAVREDGTPHCVQSELRANQWKLIYETDETGSTISGSVDDLIDAVQSALQVYVPSWNQSFKIDTTNLEDNNQVCSQSLFQVDKTTWNTFSLKATRVFYMFCSSGKYHKNQHYLGGTSRPSNPDQFGVVGIQWFSRQYCSHQEKYPYYCNNEQGYRSCGSFSKLLSAIRHGSEVGIAVSGMKVSHNVGQIIIKNGVIGAQRLRRVVSCVKQAPNNITYREFVTTDSFWKYSISSSDSTYHAARWRVGKHESLPYIENKQQVEWFIDTCWSLVLSHGTSGSILLGSINRLRASVLAGKRIRLVLNDKVAGEADSLFMESDGHVTAQLLTQISISDQSHFQDDAYWYWQLISSTGYMDIIRMFLGSNQRKSSSNSEVSVKWYADTRPWRKLLTTSASGNASTGSKFKLTKSLKSGGMLRVVVTFPNGTIIAFSPDNVEVYREEVAAQFINSVGHEKKSGYRKRVFPVAPYWNLIMATTEGTLISSLWVVGENVQVSNSSIGVTTAWFVN